MGIFCIARKQLLDRTFDLPALGALTEMLCAWAAMQTPNAINNGSSRCDAILYSFPRKDSEAIQKALAARLPDAEFDSSNPDELKITGSSTAIGQPLDLRVWQIILGDPLPSNLCAFLRLTITGDFLAFNGKPSPGQTTFVLCGIPENGTFQTKAIWRLGHDETMQLVYRLTAWELETPLLEAFDLYVLNREKHPYNAARFAFNLLGGESKNVFVARRDERRIMALIRHMAELPDDRGPIAFARRVGLPVLIGLLCLGLAFILYRDWSLLASVFTAGGIYFLFSAGRIVWRKVIRVRRYYKAMRAGLGKLYSAPADYRQMDLSADDTPTLLKCNADVAALGAQHVCDVCITTAKGVLDGNQIFWLDDTVVSLGLLRKTELLQFFPAQPILLCSTRFQDGRRHYTMNRPKYRKRSLPNITGRCLLNDGGPDELLALHRRHVDRLIRAGAVVIPPEKSPSDTLARMRELHEEARKGWQIYPYSWNDALHDAFKVCRREYLAD